MKYQIKNLVFEGGGVKGLAYAGVLEILEERGILPNVERVAGTSVGAINATLLAIGCTVDETKKILNDLNFNDFLDDDWLIVSISRVFAKFGWYSGDYFTKWIGAIIGRKLGKASATFKDLHDAGGKTLHLYGSNISTGRCELFSYATTPNMEIRTAVRISMSIPFFFSSVKVKGDYYADGGLFLNYPIKTYDDAVFLGASSDSSVAAVGKVVNPHTLGFRLDTKEEIEEFRLGKTPKGKKLDRVDKYLMAVINALMRVQETQHLSKEDWDRTVYIDTLGISTFAFDLSATDKLLLIDAGRNAALAYFAWLDDEAAAHIAKNEPILTIP